MLNQANILGHIGGVYINDKATKMIVMTNEKYKDAGGQLQEISDAHKVTVFGKTKEYVDNYIKKGDMVMVTGKLKSSKYTDKSGIEQENYGVIGQNIRTVKRKDDASPQVPQNTPSQPQANHGSSGSSNNIMDDDLPF